MKRLILICLAVLFVCAQPAGAQEIPVVKAGGTVIFGPESFESFDAWMQHLNTVNRADVVPAKKVIIEKSVEKPVATLMDPYFAKKHLRGDAWAAWAIKHNERAREVGEDRRTEVIRGTTTRIESNRGNVTITTTPLLTHKIYTGGTRTIYNPYCPPQE